MPKTLQEILENAREYKWALPHFNISNLEQLKGICEAAKNLRAPVLIGTSEGERDFIGLHQATALIKSFKDKGVCIWLNADHTFSVKAAKEAIDAGYESIHIDLSKKSFSENIAGTREVVNYAHKKNHLISVEGELGYLVTESSRVYKEKVFVNPSTFTKADEAQEFVKKTGINRFAPAVGNLHGIAANRPKLDFNLIKKLRGIVPNNVAMVLHGGSGNRPEVFKKVIKLGFNNIHISTELRLSYRNALDKSLKTKKDEIAPYKIMQSAVETTAKKAEYFIKLFGAKNRI